jgi:hypothetical protein
MLKLIKTRKEVGQLMVRAMYDNTNEGPPNQQVLLALMDVMNIPANMLDDVLNGGIACDQCGESFLACLAQVGLEGAVLCEDCKVAEDPLSAMHEEIVERKSRATFAITIHDEDGERQDVVFSTTKKGAMLVEKIIREKFCEWSEKD